ncbi:MAG: hypothetical protein HQL55_20035 [Magnetococcales bacterium]|nr:hypothetical protein [Magnetococcales bacterium]
MFKRLGGNKGKGSVGLAFAPHGVAMAWLARGGQGEPLLQAMDFATSSDEMASWVGRWKLQRLPAVAVIHPGNYPLLTINPPAEIPRNEWSDHCRWAIASRLDFPVEEAVVDLFESPLVGHSPMLYVAACPRSQVLDWLNLCQKHRFSLQTMGIWELALAGVANLFDSTRQPMGILYLDQQVTLLLIIEDGLVQLVRRLIPGLPVAGVEEELLREIKRGVAFFEERSRHRALSRVLLLSPFWHLPDFQNRLDQYLQLPVVTWSEMAGPLFASADQRHIIGCLPAIGAAWRRELAS